MNSPIEEIKQRLDLVDLIQEYVKLNPAGSNFKARCPFHNEKTASFMVSPEKQIWHCFGCSLGGDHFEFIKKIEGVEFPEALRILAKRANVKLEDKDPEHHNQKTRLWDLLRDLSDYWHGTLLNSPEAQFVRNYLAERKVGVEAIKAFQLGYAKDSWNDAILHLQNMGYSLREIELAGVSKIGETKADFQSNHPYDRLRNRLIFPIRNVHGNVVGFTGRTMAKEFEGGKYINSPQTQIYNKSTLLYNLDLAKQEIRKKDYAILVEGNMDALAAYQAGTKNVVAVSGTSLTDEQINLLKRFTQNVMISFDADVAGTKANLRGIDLAWQAGLNVKVVPLPKGQDPDDVIREDPEKWKAALRAANNFMDFVFQVTLSELDISRIDHKKSAAKKLLAVIAKLGDPVEQSYHLKKLAIILEVAEETLIKILSQINSKTKKGLPVKEIQASFKPIGQERSVAERLVALLIKFPDYFPEVLNRLEPEEIIYLPVQRLYKEMAIYYNKEQNLELSGFSGQLDQSSRDYIERLSLIIDEEIFNGTAQEIQHEISEVSKRLKKIYLKDRLKVVQKLMQQAEQAKNITEVNELSDEFSKLTFKLQDL